MSTNEDEAPQDGADSEPRPDELQLRFAAALNSELDRIGYPPAPARNNHLSADLGVSRMQAYRILRGRNMPSLKTLVKLAGQGLSLDVVLLQLTEGGLGVPCAVSVEGVQLHAITLPGRSATGLVRGQDRGAPRVRSAGPDAALAAGESYVRALLFAKPAHEIAVIEDDDDTLAVLSGELGVAFSVTPFARGNSLLAGTTPLRQFDAFVVDWHLPDISGEALVRAIRAQTRAPIILTTGDRAVSHAISEVLRLPNVRYVAKPVDGDILRALVASSIAEA